MRYEIAYGILALAALVIAITIWRWSRRRTRRSGDHLRIDLFGRRDR
jgi:hypothetical protein